MYEYKSKVYVLTNENGYIIRCEGGYTMGNIDDISKWVYIDEDTGDRYNHCQGMYFPETIRTDGGAYRYKLVDGKPVECTAEEIAQQEMARKPKITAPHNIIAGEYVTVNGTLYKATDNIPSGEVIVNGQNVIETTIEEQLAELAKGE